MKKWLIHVYLYSKQTTAEENKYNRYLLPQNHFHSPMYGMPVACQGLCWLRSSSRNETEIRWSRNLRQSREGRHQGDNYSKGDEVFGLGVHRLWKTSPKAQLRPLQGQRWTGKLGLAERFSAQELYAQVWMLGDHSGRPREEGLPGRNNSVGRMNHLGDGCWDIS